VEEQFNFWSKTMYGVNEMKPRWKRALGQTQGYLSMAIGKMYVNKYFSSDTKTKALAMVEDIRSQLEDRLKEVDWIKAESTRVKALEKVRAFGVKIGYPDKWIDYSSLEIKPNDHFGNVVRARVFGNERDLNFVNKPTDKTEWGMSPQTINAYYDPTMNEICFPAGILQPPFFNADVHDAFNYGGIGAVIGHEMTHGFDDSGRKYDSKGNLVDWWTDDDAKEFERRAAVMAAQTDSFKVFGVSPNGKLTNGENLADLGGIKLAYGALARKLAKQGEDIFATQEDGFTTQQHFFLSYAKNWATNANKESIIQQIANDPHPPHQWRANGPTSNMEEFNQAFGIQKGMFWNDAMFRAPENRVQLW
jgi:putative endopeptidase